MLHRNGLALGAAALVCSLAHAQARLTQMQGWDQHANNRPKIAQAAALAQLRVFWLADGRFCYTDGDQWVIHDPKTGEEVKQKERPEFPQEPRQGRGPARGRQFTEAAAPDGKSKAVYRARNLYLIQDGQETPITTDGSDVTRVKYGQASWVYGEELYQNLAMGFSSDSSKLWYYRFDEGQVKDYYLAGDFRRQQNNLNIEAYPKPGQSNPVVDLYVYDLASKRSVKVKARPGQFDDGVGHYLYGIRWMKDGSSLLFYRTDRRQKVLEYCAANPATGEVKVLDREENPAAWVENFCPTTFLEDEAGIESHKELSKKAVWMSERSGWLNLYWLDLEKGGVTPITKNTFDVRRVVKVDLDSKVIWYMATSSEPGRSQLHWVSFDGKLGSRVTDPAYDHSVQMAPDGSWFVDRIESVSTAPQVRLLDKKGKVVRVLRESVVEGLKDLGYTPPMPFTYTSADGKTKLSGALNYPANFSPYRTYPVLVDVYNGPLGPMSDSWSDSYRLPPPMTDFGFIVVQFETRGGGGRGRDFKNALYQKMGITEIDDIAAGVRSLYKHPFVDQAKIGIEGTSYGGYATLMALGRHPEVFSAGASQSCVSSWANYDTIYTERYMGILPESEEFYKASAALTYARNFKGNVMIYYGTEDDNTHPANALQMIKALQDEGKSFEVQVGVDLGHSGMNFRRMAEFFMERLAQPMAAR